MLRGGLDLVTPRLALPPGYATAASNYEPDIAGYRRFTGYDRYDGHPAPSDGANSSDIAARRAAISAVPGGGPVRGVWVFDGTVWAFRDISVGGTGRLYKATEMGWSLQSFGYVLDFNTGTAEIFEGDTVTGGTSGALATIDRVIVTSGVWDGSAAGYLVLSSTTGTFSAAETITSSSGGSAKALGSANAVTIPGGGRYDFVNHNFYGATKHERMYFANGTGPAFEWSGTWLAPIRSGNAAGTLDSVAQILNRTGGKILTRANARVIARGDFDRPTHIGEFRNHLFLSFGGGGVLHSGIGEPLDFRALVGAGEIDPGSDITGFITSASTAFILFGRNRIDYLTGNDSSDWVKQPITDNAGGGGVDRADGWRQASLSRRRRRPQSQYHGLLRRLAARHHHATDRAAVPQEAGRMA
jgi:hypothetical protein